MDYSAVFLSMGGNDWGLKFIGQSFLLIFICVLIVVATYYLTKYLSRARMSGKAGGNVYIVEVISVGINSTVQLIKAGGQYILIGVSKDRIVFLTEIDPDDLKFPEFKPIISKGSFDKYLKKFLNKGSAEDSDNPEDNGDNNDETPK